MGVLTGKTALVFGGSGGIGMETVKLLSEHGAKVVVSSNNRERDEEAVSVLRQRGGEAACITGDYTSEAFIDSAFDFVMKTYDLPELVVNAAGVGSSGQVLGKATYEGIERMLRINVISPYIVMQKAIVLLQAAGRPGRIINIGSLRSHYTGKEGNAPVYAASKAAIRWLTESTARVLHKPGNRIGVSVICPGAVNTQMNNGPDGPDNPLYMSASTVAQCVLSAALMPEGATLFDMTMLSMEQNPW